MEDVKERSIPSKAKAALLVRNFTTNTAQEVVGYLSKDEQEKLAHQITSLEEYSLSEINQVMAEFIAYFSSRSIGNMGDGIDYLRTLFSHMPEKEFERMLGRVYYDADNPFEFLKKVKDVEPLIAILANEDAQTIALVMSYLEPKMAGELLQSLPDEKQIETIVGAAKAEQIDSELLNSISNHLSKKVEKMSVGEQNQEDGIKTVVNVLNNVPRGTEKFVLDKLSEMDTELAEEIRENLFTFEDINSLDNLTLQKVLNEVQDIATLAKAMKSAKEELKEKLYASMSSGRREMIDVELEGMGPLKLKDAEKAQQTIANLVKELEKSGKIEIARGDEDVIV